MVLSYHQQQNQREQQEGENGEDGICPIPVHPLNIAATVFIFLVPIIVAILLEKVQQVYKNVNWFSCRKLADVLYMVYFIFVLVESDKFERVLCYVGEDDDDDDESTTEPRGIECWNIGCEVLYVGVEDPNDVPDDCQLCYPHWQVMQVLKFPMLIAPISALSITATQHIQNPTPGLFRFYKNIHLTNTIIWYGISLTIKIYRCHCKWTWSIDYTMGYFGPLCACLYLYTRTAERNWNLEHPRQEQEKEEEKGKQSDSCSSENCHSAVCDEDKNNDDSSRKEKKKLLEDTTSTTYDDSSMRSRNFNGSITTIGHSSSSSSSIIVPGFTYHDLTVYFECTKQSQQERQQQHLHANASTERGGGSPDSDNKSATAEVLLLEIVAKCRNHGKEPIKDFDLNVFTSSSFAVQTIHPPSSTVVPVGGRVTKKMEVITTKTIAAAQPNSLYHQVSNNGGIYLQQTSQDKEEGEMIDSRKEKKQEQLKLVLLVKYTTSTGEEIEHIATCTGFPPRDDFLHDY